VLQLLTNPRFQGYEGTTQWTEKQELEKVGLSPPPNRTKSIIRARKLERVKGDSRPRSGGGGGAKRDRDGEESRER
jgi:hypothetical protein